MSRRNLLEKAVLCSKFGRSQSLSVLACGEPARGIASSKSPTLNCAGSSIYGSSKDRPTISWYSMIAAGSALSFSSLALCEKGSTTEMSTVPVEAQDANPYSVADFAPSEKFPSSIVLYQYEVCPFCCKVKAFLDFHNIPYKVVEVDPLRKSELSWSDYKKVPVVLLDDQEQLNNSASIISQLSVDLQERSSNRRGWVFPKQPPSSSKLGKRDEIWRRWVDEKLVRLSL
jgi:microsomal prostaglandin-E synthase 2